MQGPTKIDYSKLFSFDMLSDELLRGVDFKNPTVAAIGATPSTKTMQPMLSPLEAAGPGAPVMVGLGGRKVSQP
jgi:hypothetical protein